MLVKLASSTAKTRALWGPWNSIKMVWQLSIAQGTKCGFWWNQIKNKSRHLWSTARFNIRTAVISSCTWLIKCVLILIQPSLCPLPLFPFHYIPRTCAVPMYVITPPVVALSLVDVNGDSWAGDPHTDPMHSTRKIPVVNQVILHKCYGSMCAWYHYVSMWT